MLAGSSDVDDLYERNTVEVRIPSADPADSVLAHQDRGLRVVKQVAGKVVAAAGRGSMQ